MTKRHSANCHEEIAQFFKDNDFIYHRLQLLVTLTRTRGARLFPTLLCMVAEDYLHSCNALSVRHHGFVCV